MGVEGAQAIVKLEVRYRYGEDNIPPVAMQLDIPVDSTKITIGEKQLDLIARLNYETHQGDLPGVSIETVGSQEINTGATFSLNPNVFNQFPSQLVEYIVTGDGRVYFSHRLLSSKVSFHGRGAEVNIHVEKRRVTLSILDEVTKLLKGGFF